MTRAPRSIVTVLATLATVGASVLAGCASDGPDATSPKQPTSSTLTAGFSPITVYPVGTTTTSAAATGNEAGSGSTVTTVASSSDATTTSATPTSATPTGPVSATTVSASTASATTSSPPELKIADAISVADCIKFVPIGAVLGDSEATDLWAVIGRDFDELSVLCIGLVAASPGTLDSLSLKLAAFELAQAPIAAAGATTTSGPAGASASFAAMPDVVCTSLQDAAAQIVAVAGEVVIRTFDASGDDRTPLAADADWLVVTQSPEPGAQLTDGDALLGAVQYGEPSDC